MIGVLAALVLQSGGTGDFRADLDLLVSDLRENGAYIRSDGVDLDALKNAYRPKFASVPNRDLLLALFEAFVGELHDFHASLGTNSDSSPRLVPSGTDLFGRWEGERAFVDQVQTGSLAEKAGIAAGDEIVALQGVSPREASVKWFGVRKPDKRGWDWALNSALAGRWDVDRSLTLSHLGKTRQIRLKTAVSPMSGGRLTVENRSGGIVVVRPENSLGDDGLIGDFDRLLPALRAARGIVLDLRNTPSGGNSTVARGIMGDFISKRLPFQRHTVDEAETGTVRDWVEYATPRTPSPARAEMVVLVGRWTGSMGEGLAIGFDAMRRATVVGTPMAGLRGAVEGFTLPKSGYRVFFPTEKVFHVNGTARHDWIPSVKVEPSSPDAWWKAAMQVFERHSGKHSYTYPIHGTGFARR